MAVLRAACLAVLFFVTGASGLYADQITLTARTGDLVLEGTLLGFDGEFYRLDTVYGELSVDSAGVSCAGAACPDPATHVARVTFSGAPLIGRVLMPALVEAFALRAGYRFTRETSERTLTLGLAGKDDGAPVAEFVFRLTSSDEGFADLLANEADIAMTLREARPAELDRAREAGLGALDARGRSLVLALDALVPVVAPGQALGDIALVDLGRVVTGEIDNWQALGGPDAPIALHLPAQGSGLGQAMAGLLPGVGTDTSATRHRDGPGLVSAIRGDPLALGLASRSEPGDIRALALRDTCGLPQEATRAALLTAEYPLTLPLVLYLPARRLAPPARAFLAYLQTPSAALVIRRAGFVDHAPDTLGLDVQGRRLAHAILRAKGARGLRGVQQMVRSLAPLARLTPTFRFAEGGTQLDASSQGNLLRLARALERGDFDGRRLVFVGFAGPGGTTRETRADAQSLAETVREAVIAMAPGADRDRIETRAMSFGSAMPVTCDEGAAAARLNRRVEVWLR